MWIRREAASFHGEIEIFIGKRFIPQSEVPPFLIVVVESIFIHKGKFLQLRLNLCKPYIGPCRLFLCSQQKKKRTDTFSPVTKQRVKR